MSLTPPHHSRETFISHRARQFGETIFSEISALAQSHGAVNLGQGFPDFDPPEFVLQAAHSALASGNHQYARSAGHLSLVETIASQLEPALGRRLDPLAEITVTVGATEALLLTALAFIDPGDEVILLEPFYDSYPADIALSGGLPRFVPMRPDAQGRWSFDPEELKAAFSHRTKLIFVNTPHNPTGKIFTPDELQLIAQLCLQHDTLAICDEVYEKICFDGKPHQRLAALDGMWDHTVTISSAGKTFSATGWKIGWIVANPTLSLALRRIHQWVPFAVATPLQLAVAGALQEAAQNGYYAALTQMYQAKRDRLVDILQRVDLQPFVPEGTYFVMADVTRLGLADDFARCRALIVQAGVATIPPSAFYSPQHKALAQPFARFCFCKKDETLDQVEQRLLTHFSAHRF
jgi:N-succinyldiaminopimelate aminotransferase